LEALLEVVLTTIELGGIDLAPSAYEAVLAQANHEEWAWIEPRVHTVMPKSGDCSVKSSCPGHTGKNLSPQADLADKSF